MKNWILIFAVSLANLSWGQPEVKPTIDSARFIAETISQKDLKNRLTVLASDNMEGRELGTEANRKAARYIAGELEKMGIRPYNNKNEYFQPIPFYASGWDNIKVKIDGEEFKFMKDYYAFMNLNGQMPEFTTQEIVFLGYGIDDSKYSDYIKADVTNKVVVFYKGEPVNTDGISQITGSTDLSSWSSSILRKLRTAKSKGVKAVLIVDDQLTKNLGNNRRRLMSRGLRLQKPRGINDESDYANHFYISTTMFKKLIGDKQKKIIKARNKMTQKGKSKPVILPVEVTLSQKKTIVEKQHENILALIPGSDPELKDEIVIITAHYDHIGKRGDVIFNGADDNGSGSVTLMDIAEAYHFAQKNGFGPRRSVLCMWVTGEEKGLLGSQYYTDNPIFPLKNTIANVNIDMVGRVDEKHQNNPYYIYVIGADRLSSELHNINETANRKYSNLELDYTYNAEDDPNRYYYRSDHYNFAKKNIPSIFYFSGTHEDYHQPGDTVDKINYEKMERVARHIFYTSWELANRDKRIEVDMETSN